MNLLSTATSERTMSNASGERQMAQTAFVRCHQDDPDKHDAETERLCMGTVETGVDR